jgi:DNA-binding transcriptional regulator YiaG
MSVIAVLLAMEKETDTAPTWLYHRRMSNAIDVVLRSEGRQAVRTGRLHRVRTASNLSQVELGRALGLTAAAVQRWEAGERLPRGASAEQLALLLRELEEAATKGDP